MERWKDVNHPVYKDFYQVSNLGRVKTKTREVWRGGEKNRYKFILGSRIVNFRSGKYPHLFSSFFAGENQEYRNKTMYLHKLVAEAFIKRPSEEHIYVTHKDGNYLNNTVSNLKWITASENSKRNIQLYPENGLKLRNWNIETGRYEKMKSLARNPKNLKKIKKLQDLGVTQEGISKIIGCSPATVYNILKELR